MRARIAVLPADQQKLTLHDVELAEPTAHEVIVEQFAAGLCHSQLHQIHQTQRPDPLVLGHESTGSVVAVGSAVDYVAPGDRVLVSWLPRNPAGRRPAPSQVVLPDGGVAKTHNTFTWSTHAVVDEQFVVKAPDGTPADVGAIVGCAVMTGAGAVRNSVTIEPGRSVVVWGVGGVGLSAVAAARELGAAPIVAVDLTEDKLKLAEVYGATHGLDAADSDVVEQVLAATDGGADFAFDCIGLPVTTRQCLAVVRFAPMGLGPGGTAVLVGAPQAPVEVDGRDLMIGEKRLVGSFGGDCVAERDFATFLEWHASGRVDLSALITDRYGLDDINQAVDDLRSGRIGGRAILEF